MSITVRQAWLVLLGTLMLCVSMTHRVSASIEYTELLPWERCDVFFGNRPDIFIDGSNFDPEQQFFIDMDGDGISEFRIFFFWGSGVAIQGLTEDAQIYGGALAIQRGEPIGPDLDEPNDELRWAHRNISSPGFGINRFRTDYFRASAIPGGTARDFIAVRFDIDGQVHYGWILVDFFWQTWELLALYGWAYESEPDTALRAGATTDEVYPLEITCQRSSIGSLGRLVWLTWRGAIIGHRYLMEYSDDMIDWKPAREEIVAKNKLITAKSVLLPETEGGNPRARYYRVRDLGEE
jgi:hypothetical protein